MAVEAFDPVTNILDRLPLRSRIATFHAKVRRINNRAIVGRMNFYKGIDTDWPEDNTNSDLKISSERGITTA